LFFGFDTAITGLVDLLGRFKVFLDFTQALVHISFAYNKVGCSDSHIAVARRLYPNATMEGFDPISMTYMATNFEAVDNAATVPNMYSNMMMMPNDFMEQFSTYDSQTVYPTYIYSNSITLLHQSC
jgi:hypothetical protein